jgi:hypothetical protein
VLLKVKTEQDEDETYLQLTYVGGKIRNIARPFDPYFYTLDLEQEGEVQPVERTLLSSLIRTNLLKASFPNTQLLAMSRNAFSMEDEVPYDQRVAIDRGFKLSSPLPSHDAWDLVRNRCWIYFETKIEGSKKALQF